MMRRGTPSAAVAVAVAACAFAALTSCSSNPSNGPALEAKPSSPPTTTSPQQSPTHSPKPTPTPSGPCGDGRCDIKVAVGDVLTLPPTYGLGPVKVTAIGGGKVDMTAPVTGSGYSISGCSGGGSVSSDGGGAVSFSCAEGPAATINEAMTLKVTRITPRSATLTINPAK
jgi:hypothetical protein